MTAPPPPTMPLLTECLHVPSYFAPACPTTDSAFSWTMSSLQRQKSVKELQPTVAQSHHPASPLTNHNASGALLFITGTTPADFKSKKNMTKVRKKAMASHLEKEKRPSMQGEHSSGSRASVDSQENTDSTINDEAVKTQRDGHRRRGRETSSPLRSPTSSHHGQQSPNQDMQITRPRQSLDFVLPSAPMVIPMRTDVSLPYDEEVVGPFESIGENLDPFRAMFQANHPKISVERLKFHCSRSFGTRAMGQHWIPTVIKSPHAFLSTLCIASAHYDAIQECQVSSVQTLALRQEVMHRISQNLLNPESRVDDFNIIALTQLIASEIVSGEDTAMNYHERGVEAFIQQRGGVNQLGVNGRLASTVSWVSLVSAILREARPRSIYSDYCASASSKNYLSTTTVPESPLFCPRAREYESVRRSLRCSRDALDLLRDIRMLMDLYLHETKQIRQNFQSLKNICKKITQYPPISELQSSRPLTPNDWKYEAIRITSILQATAIIKRIPLSESLDHAAQAGSITTPQLQRSVIPPNNPRHDSLTTGYTSDSTYFTAFMVQQSNPFAYVLPRPSLPSTMTGTNIPNSNSQEIAKYKPDTLLQSMKTSIEHSDLSDCWADMAGVLLWVGLTAGASSRNSDKVLKKWFAALTVRVSIVLCFEHPEAVHATLLRMGEMIEALGYPSDNAAEGKKRKM